MHQMTHPIGAAPLKPSGPRKCMVHRYVPAKHQAYGQVRFKGKKLYCHILAAAYKEGRAPEPGEEASHLCGNAACINWEHMCFEGGRLNRSRDACQLFWGVRQGYVCPHEPLCIVEAEHQ